jgi:hypothetical protein
MNLINQVYGSLRWKKTDDYCALKLGISLEKYQEVKRQISSVKDLLQNELDSSLVNIVGQRMLDLIDEDSIKNTYISDLENQLVDAINQNKEKVVEFRENLEDGTAEIKGIAFTEPKSPEEIIRILKIDTDKWKLSSYWNKQHRDYWLISAMVSHKKLEAIDYLAETLKTFQPKYLPVAEVHINDKYSKPTVGVLSIQDLHFGKEGNAEVVQAFREAVSSLVYRAYHSHQVDKIIYVFGGDILNMDTFSGQTTKLTNVDNEQRAQDAYNQAYESIYWSINFIKQFCNQLEVVYLPGNHDRLSSYHLAHGLSKSFCGEQNIIFNVSYAERKVITYGSNFFAFEHGDITSKDTPLLYATEFATEWGATTYRTCYTGHFHKKKTVEYITENERHGFALKHLPSLCKSDYWHYHMKYTGAKRQAILELHDANTGKVCELVYNA